MGVPAVDGAFVFRRKLIFELLSNMHRKHVQKKNERKDAKVAISNTGEYLIIASSILSFLEERPLHCCVSLKLLRTSQGSPTSVRGTYHSHFNKQSPSPMNHHFVFWFSSNLLRLVVECVACAYVFEWVLLK